MEQDFKALFFKYRAGLVHFSAHILRNEDDAMEVVNDVFVSIWEKRDQLKLDDSLKNYLYTSVKNRSLNFLKKAGLQYVDAGDDIPIASPDPGILERIAAMETEKQVKALIDALPQKCKQVFLLSRMEQLSYKEIADLLEISTKTVENHIGLALKFIKAGMQRGSME